MAIELMTDNVRTVSELVVPLFDDDVEVVQKLDDEPNSVGGLTAAELKYKFDEGNIKIKEYLNNVLVPGVSSTVAEEAVRAQNEAQREENEAQRVAAEQERVSAEAEREQAEAERRAGETDRAAAEAARKTAEDARALAEQNRVDTDNGIVAQATSAAEAAENAANRAVSAAVHQPVVGDNGNWHTWSFDAGDYVDTGIYAGGDAPYIGENGNWYVGQTDTGVSATSTGVYVGSGEMPDGYHLQIDPNGEETDFIPYIGSNGHWFVGDTDLDVPATGPAGPAGPTGADGERGPAGPALAVTNTAAIGQTIRVSAVDENGQPTEWEAVDIPTVDDTLTQVGQAADAAAVGERFSQLSEEIENLPSGETATADIGYKWASRGYMRENVRDFQGWAHCIQYDPELDLAVGIVISGTGPHSNAQPWYRVTIDPKSGYMSDYEKIVVLDTDGETVFVPETGYIGSFKILSDGTYMLIDGKQNIYISPDKGKTLVRKLQYDFSSSSDGSMFGLTELSNGRLLVGHGGQKNVLYYSNDQGTTWTAVIPDNSGLGAQVYPEGNYVPFEPCFIEIADGKVLCVARASMNAYKTYADGILTVQEAAVISRSEDYGATWSAWEWSKSIADMTANNMKAVVIDGKVHAVYGSRYHGFVDDLGNEPHFALRYACATPEDAYADKWSGVQVIDVGHWDKETASYSSDCGYPSIFAHNGNLFVVYYDSDGTGSAFGANWRQVLGSLVAQVQTASTGGGSLNVAYTQAAVDAIVSSLTVKINDLYIKIGELPPDAEDGEYPVVDGLVEWFEAGDSAQWTDYTIASKVDSGKTGTGTNCGGSSLYFHSKVAPTTFDNNMMSGGIVFDATTADYGIESEFTLEFLTDPTDNQHVLSVVSAPVNWSGANTRLLEFNNSFNTGNYVTVACHIMLTVSGVNWVLYKDGAQCSSGTVGDGSVWASAGFIIRPWGSGAVGGIRLYNRVLTADEIKTNYTYASKQTTIGADYF